VGLVVCLAGDADDPVGAELPDGLLEGVLVTAGDGDTVATGDERLSDTVADAAAGAGDDGDAAAVKLLGHEVGFSDRVS
jgi:hypothetical protein